jgi:4-aminobutyrate---pyruvate transaminase
MHKHVLPISAVLINDRVHEAMLVQSDKFGNFAHGFTYAGHPVAAAVALEVQKIYTEIDIVTVNESPPVRGYSH